MIEIIYRPKQGPNETLHIVPLHGWVGMTFDYPCKQLFLRCEITDPSMPEGCGKIRDLAACDILSVEGQKVGPCAEIAVSTCFECFRKSQERRSESEGADG